MIGAKENQLERAVLVRYLPNAVKVNSSNPEADLEIVPLLKDRNMVDGESTAYVCEGFVCQRPVTSSEELHLQLNPSR